MSRHQSEYKTSLLVGGLIDDELSMHGIKLFTKAQRRHRISE